MIDSKKNSTTRKLMCLDHIYTRHLNAQQAGVVPIYYSYHDMTYISVDMNEKRRTYRTVGQKLTRSDLNFFASDPMSGAIFQ
jgi:hypothetical protein